MEYIKVAAAAKLMGISVQAVYQAIRVKTLKSIKLCGVIHTSEEWIRDYNSKLHSKDEHARFNGMRTFDPEKGEYSIKMVADMFGVFHHTIYWMIFIGQLTAYRKGMYWVIPQEQIAVAEKILREERKIA